MEFNTEKIEEMGKAMSEEMKRCGFGSGNNLYEVENAMRELQRQASLIGSADFLEEADDELYEEVKKSKNAYYLHSFRPAVIWSVFGKISFERRYYRSKNTKERKVKGFALLDKRMGFSSCQVTPSLAELLALLRKNKIEPKKSCAM